MIGYKVYREYPEMIGQLQGTTETWAFPNEIGKTYTDGNFYCWETLKAAYRYAKGLKNPVIVKVEMDNMTKRYRYYTNQNMMVIKCDTITLIERCPLPDFSKVKESTIVTIWRKSWD